MKFIGQNHIMKELKYILPKAYADNSFNINLMLKANSGYGKTEMGLKIGRYIGGESFIYCLAEKDASLIALKISTLSKRVFFIDEVHLFTDPEPFYPLMDSKKYFFIFATNQSAKLKEPFENRCVNFLFESYSQEELRLITREKIPLCRNEPNNFIDLIIKAGEDNPRKISMICIRLNTIFNSIGIPNTEELKVVLEDILNIKEGLDIRERSYLSVLTEMDTASLDTISSILGYSKDIIKYEIEPSLLYKKLITISSKGRTIKNVTHNN
jgi:Holliday junction resolvasome RuvABC ATP-dependent DNA helicase subunit